MAEDSSDKRNNSDSSVNSLGKHLEKIKKDNTEKAKIIEDTNNVLDKNTNEFVDELKLAEKETDSDIVKINSKITVLKNGVDKFFKDSEKEIALITGALEKTASSLRRWSLVLLGIFSALFFATYFLVSYFLSPVIINNIKVDPIFITGIITISGIFVIIIKTFSSTKSELDKLKDKTPTELTELQGTILPITKEKISLESKFGQTNNRLENLRSNLKKVIVYTKAYVPGLQEFYSGIEAKNKQEYFALSMRNALQEYGLLDSQIQNMLSKFSSMKNTEEEWLDETANNIEKNSSINAYIIKLCYYDHVNNQGNLKDIWRIIVETSHTENLIDILVRKTNHNGLNAKTKGAFTDIISGLKPFTLSDFLNIYNKFYVEFEKEKKILVHTLSDLGFKLNDDKKSRIMEFFPTSIQYDVWFNELINNTSEILSIDVTVLWLLYLDRTGAELRKATVWSSVQQQDDVIRSLANTLVGIRPYPTDTYNKKDLQSLFYSIIKNKSDFNLQELDKTFLDQIQGIERTKSLFAFSLESKNNPIPGKIRIDHYDKLLLYTDNLEEELAKKLNEYLGLDYDFILLFYYDYIQNIVQRKSKFRGIQNYKKTDSLADLLFNNRIFIMPEKSLSNTEIQVLSKIMMFADDFDMEKLRDSYSFYRKMLIDSRNLIEFLEEQKINNTRHMELDNLINIFDKIDKTSRYDTMKAIALKLVKKEQIRELNQDQIIALIEAGLVLFFTKYYDLTREEACKMAALRDLSVKILYRWIDEKGDEKFREEKTILSNVADQVISGLKNEFDNINDFRAELEKGTLRVSIKELMGARFDKIDHVLEKVIQNDTTGIMISENVSTAITSMMSTKIQNHFVAQAVNSQIISAYMLTANTGPVLEIVNDYLDTACSELAATEQQYRDLIILETDKPTTGGKWTRVGLVPLKIKDFDEFSNLFNSVFKRAVELYLKQDKNKGRNMNEFSANLIRIFPSNLTFKPVHPANADSGQHDITESIRKLILTKLKSFDKIRITAAAQKSEPTIALRDIIFSLFDTSTSIFVITEDLVSEIIKENNKLHVIMENKEFDRMLIESFYRTTLTELAIDLHNKYQVDKIGTENSFIQKMQDILNKSNIRMEKQRVEELSKLILKRLSDVGSILNVSPTVVAN